MLRESSLSPAHFHVVCLWWQARISLWSVARHRDGTRLQKGQDFRLSWWHQFLTLFPLLPPFLLSRGRSGDRRRRDAQRAIHPGQGARPGRHGHRLPGDRPVARAERGHQIAEGFRHREGSRADPPRGPDPRQAGSRQDRAVVRLRRVGRDLLPGHGGGERAELRESLARPAPGRSAADLRTGGGGARLRTPPGGDPPRRQTGQRLAHAERRGEALRLRSLARHRRPKGPERDDPGHPDAT